MNCACCPHMKRITAALRPCQNCDAGRLHGEVHVDGWAADRAHAQRVISDHTQSTGVTALPPDVEDTLRKLFCTFAQMRPEHQLLAVHVLNGGSYASFAEVLNRMFCRMLPKIDEIRGRKNGFRQLAKTWADKIVDSMPIFKDVFRARIEEA